MTPTVKVGTVLIEREPAMDQALGLESEPYSRNWSVVKALDGFALDRKIYAAGGQINSAQSRIGLKACVFRRQVEGEATHCTPTIDFRFDIREKNVSRLQSQFGIQISYLDGSEAQEDSLSGCPGRPSTKKQGLIRTSCPPTN